MIVTSEVRFRHRLDPYEWKFDGREGTAYSFEAIDLDDSKVRVKCSPDTWHALSSANKGDLVTFTGKADKVRVWDDQITVKAAAQKAA